MFFKQFDHFIGTFELTVNVACDAVEGRMFEHSICSVQRF